MMPKYKRLLPGKPFVIQPPLTEGFTEGVGYFRNFIHHKPIWLISVALLGLGAVSLSVQFYLDSKKPNELKHLYGENYRVVRKSDIKDPTKDCYN